MHPLNTIQNLQEISDIASEADAAFELQKSQWDEERLALDRRNNIVAEEKNKLHHELCTIRAQLCALWGPVYFSCVADSFWGEYMWFCLQGPSK